MNGHRLPGMPPALEARYARGPGPEPLYLHPNERAIIRHARAEGAAALADVIGGGHYAVACMERAATGRPLPDWMAGMLRWSRIHYKRAGARVRDAWTDRGASELFRRARLAGAAAGGVPSDAMPTRSRALVRHDRTGERSDPGYDLLGLMLKSDSAGGASGATLPETPRTHHNIQGPKSLTPGKHETPERESVGPDDGDPRGSYHAAGGARPNAGSDAGTVAHDEPHASEEA